MSMIIFKTLQFEDRRSEKHLACNEVWDSSIVVAKYFEKIQGTLPGKACLDLSAGCGLVGMLSKDLLNTPPLLLKSQD